ncbi:sigma-54 interaction domain-containing protein [Enterocloster lavalensis]|uniref:sigma-54 interaction domain-containing protein n=1 Tax=Enterocloster lavalensis TaxID=460384 RepID=UPI002A81FB00|nr:sigma 54-interacting transcriptional regulator [Enterocloster lavalensis]
MVMNELLLPDLFTLLDSLDWGISFIDENGKFLWVNRYVLKCSGRPRKFYEGKSVYDFQSLGILDTPVCSEVFRLKKKVTHLQYSYTGSGTLGEFIVTATPIFDSNGNVKYAVADRMDVRHLKERHELVLRERQQHDASKIKVESKKLELIYRSGVMEKLVKDVERAAAVASVILLQGESGTGKDVFAHYIHENSPYRNGPMIEINCASMPESLLESELFGYTKGAFTGALNTGKEGLIEAADKGTLFLDEINSMPLGLQAKLLRVLESRSITRIGSTKPIDVDFRLIAATNRSLVECVEERIFRADLYYRLNVIPVTIPPLRERKEDIPVLTDFFLDKFCDRYSLQKKFAKRVYRTFEAYSWPGNVRELKNIVERMVIMSTVSTITINEIPQSMFSENGFPAGPEPELDEKERIRRALEINNGHREKTARYLSISRRTLQYKLKKYGLN